MPSKLGALYLDKHLHSVLVGVLLVLGSETRIYMHVVYPRNARNSYREWRSKPEKGKKPVKCVFLPQLASRALSCRRVLGTGVTTT